MSASLSPSLALPNPGFRESRGVNFGRTFVGPVFDYMLIGGGLSLLTLAYLPFGAAPFQTLLRGNLWTLMLLCNATHFAGSTVRLYTKQGGFRDLPFVTMGLPLVTLGVIGLGLALPTAVGASLIALRLFWSPFHYAAQTFGLSMIYCYRSEAALSLPDRRLLRAACLLPFVNVLLGGVGAGLLRMPALLTPGLTAAREQLMALLAVLSFLAPLLLFAKQQLGRGPRLPLIVLLLLLTNSVWLVYSGYTGLFGLNVVAIFHGVQYLAILAIFHVREQATRPDPRPWWLHVLRFYAACLGLGYLLFHLLPLGVAALGVTLTEALLVTNAVVVMHHFLVDGFIWKLRKDPNYRVVAEALPAL